MNQHFIFLNMHLRNWGCTHSALLPGQRPGPISNPGFLLKQRTLLSVATNLICPPNYKGAAAGCSVLPQGLSFTYSTGFYRLESKRARGRETLLQFRGTERHEGTRVNFLRTEKKRDWNVNIGEPAVPYSPLRYVSSSAERKRNEGFTGKKEQQIKNKHLNMKKKTESETERVECGNSQ